jgi:hypothetical protein
VDVTFNSVLDNESAKNVLRTAAVHVDFINCFSRMCSTQISVSALKDIASIASVQLLHPLKVATQVGLVTSEGDRAMFADVACSKYSVNGSGLLIGVLSDSYNCFGGAANDTLSGDLPSKTNSIVILADLIGDECVDGIDEGRAMMQLIHDVAPGKADAAAGILELAAAGCDVIVDDIIYYKEPMFQGCGLIVFQWDDPFFSPEALLDHEVIWKSIFSLAMRLLPVLKILMLEETLSKY